MGNNMMDRVDIDRILNTIAEPEDDDSAEIDGNLIDITNARVYRRFQKRAAVAKGLYRSPLIQSEHIAYNPEPGRPVAGDKVIVRSLFKYSSAKEYV